MWWPFRRQRRPGRHWHPPARVPDNDVILHPGDRRSADIMRAVLESPTRAMPVYQPAPQAAPLLTPGQRWRTRRGAW